LILGVLMSLVAMLIRLPTTIPAVIGDLNGVNSMAPFDTAGLLVKLYGDFTYLCTVTLIIYLLFVLLVCVAVVGGSTGSLRNFN
jgi:hypothetical protein